LRAVSGQCGIPKSSLARHRQAHLPAALVVASEREMERQHDLFVEAQAVRRSLEGWGALRDRADWLDLCQQADADYESGKFLINRLGAERHLNPEQVATLLHLRRRIVTEMALATGLELMLLDLAMIAYANALRLQEWVGGLALLVEHDLFRDEGPTVKTRGRYGGYAGLKAEDDGRRIREELLPAQDRATRSFINAVKALREFRASAVSVSIGQAAQVNVGEQQLVVAPTAPPFA